MDSLNKPRPTIVDNSEADLVLRAAKGVEDARRELFERHREAAYRAALRITGRHEDALDAVQDGFIKAFDGLGGFQQDSSFKTWLLRIVSNRALDLLRARRVRLAASLDVDDDSGGANAVALGQKLADDAADPPGAALERGELADRLRAALEQLPPEQRAVFALAAEGEHTYAEIAAVLGIPVGTVMSRLFHARRKLSEMLADLAPRGAATSE